MRVIKVLAIGAMVACPVYAQQSGAGGAGQAGAAQGGAGLGQTQAGAAQGGAGLGQTQAGAAQGGAGLGQTQAGAAQGGAGLGQTQAGAAQGGAGLGQTQAGGAQGGAGLGQTQAGGAVRPQAGQNGVGPSPTGRTGLERAAEARAEAGVPAAGQAGLNRAGQAQQGQTGINRSGTQSQFGTGQQSSFDGFSQTPWFSDSSVQQQLRLPPDQVDRLRNNYTQSWERYQKELSGLPSDLTEEQLNARRQQLGQSFSSEFNSALEEAIPDQTQRQRFQQLMLQHQGVYAFDNPTIQQRLNLTPEQRERISRMQQDWRRQMGQLNSRTGTSPSANANQNAVLSGNQGTTGNQNSTLSGNRGTAGAQSSAQIGNQGDRNNQANESSTLSGNRGIAGSQAASGNQDDSSWNDFYRRSNQSINELLTPDQRRTWQELRGEDFSFPRSAYFPQVVE
jgi:hypothetical protein